MDCNTKLRVIANRRIELAFGQGYNIGLGNTNPE